VSYGCRHNLTFAGSTDISVRGATLGGDRFSSVETRGSNNVGIDVQLTRISGPGDSLGAGNTAIVFGYEEALAGDHECVVRGGVIENYSGDTAKIVSFRPPSTKCGIRDITLYKCSQLFHHTDQEDDADLVAEDCYVENITVFEHDNADYLAYCDGGYFGSTVKTLKNFRMSNIVVDKFGQGMRFIQVNGLKLEDIRLSNQLSGIGDKFAFKFQDITGLKLLWPVMDKPQWGVSLAGTPNAVILGPVFLAVQNATPLILDVESGTCNGTVFKHWEYELTAADPVMSVLAAEVEVQPPVGYAYALVDE